MSFWQQHKFQIFCLYLGCFSPFFPVHLIAESFSKVIEQQQLQSHDNGCFHLFVFHLFILRLKIPEK